MLTVINGQFLTRILDLNKLEQEIPELRVLKTWYHGCRYKTNNVYWLTFCLSLATRWANEWPRVTSSLPFNTNTCGERLFDTLSILAIRKERRIGGHKRRSNNQCQLLSINVNYCQLMSIIVNYCHLLSISVTNSCQDKMRWEEYVPDSTMQQVKIKKIKRSRSILYK